MTIGERIKSFRKQMNMTQGQFAKLIGVKQSAVSKYENNLVSLTSRQVDEIAAALEIDPVFFLDSVVSDEEFNNHQINYFRDKTKERVNTMMYGSPEAARHIQEQQALYDNTMNVVRLNPLIIGREKLQDNLNQLFEELLNNEIEELIPNYTKLNNKGREEVKGYVDKLSQIPEYTAPDSSSAPDHEESEGE